MAARTRLRGLPRWSSEKVPLPENFLAAFRFEIFARSPLRA